MPHTLLNLLLLAHRHLIALHSLGTATNRYALNCSASCITPADQQVAEGAVPPATAAATAFSAYYIGQMFET